MTNSNFLLTDDEGNNIAVISKKGKATPTEFNKAIELAVKEHDNFGLVSMPRTIDVRVGSHVIATMPIHEPCQRAP